MVKNNEIQFKVNIQLKHNYNTKATNIDKTGERGKVPIGKAIQATEPGWLSDRSENSNKMFFELY